MNKPADKNLSIVLLNTNDYITQCTNHLSDTNTYWLASKYPKNIKKQLRNTIISFKPQISLYSKKLYEFLLSEPDHCHIPQIPKIHKKFTQVPPVRPIISQCSSVFNPTARFIDHVLQPLAQSYTDCLHNSTSLSLVLQTLSVPDNAILVTLDVSNLYPSIPQTCSTLSTMKWSNTDTFSCLIPTWLYDYTQILITTILNLHH